MLPTPLHRPLTSTPPSGTHPRLFFGPEDLPELQQRVQTGPRAREALSRLHDEAALLRKSPVYVALRDDTTLEWTSFAEVLVSDPNRMFLGTAAGGFYGQLAAAAYAAYVEEDDQLGRELGIVASRAAKLHATAFVASKPPAPPSDASLDLAFAYDVLFEWMDSDARALVRELLSRMTAGRMPFAAKRAPQQQSIGETLRYDSLVLTSLAIEGELGYDPELFNSNIAKLRSFTSAYGIHAAGYVHEDWGNFSQGMHQGSLMLLAAARRGHDWFDAGRIHQAMLQPLVEALPWQPGRLAGHGVGASFSHGVGASALYPILSYLYPDHVLVDFLRQQTEAAGGDARQRDAPLPEAVFGEPGDSRAIADVAARLDLPPTFFDPDRGLLNARSSFAPTAAVVSFDCRMDTWDLPNVHADRGNFTFLALEREWITDGTPEQVGSAWHARVTIDGIGPSDAPRMPARLLDFGFDSRAAFATCDVAPAYRFNRLSNSGEVDTGYVWQDFRYAAADAPEEWRTHAVRAQSEHLPVRRAERTLVLVRKPFPFLVVYDAIDHDGAAHDYVWRAPLQATVEGEPQNEGLMLTHRNVASMAEPRLWVRALSPETAEPPRLERDTAALETGDTQESLNLVVKATTTAPDIVVVLVPLRACDEPPALSWSGRAGELRVARRGEGEIVRFERDAQGVLAVGTRPLP